MSKSRKKRERIEKKARKARENTEKRKLKKQINHLIKINKILEAGIIIQRYKSRYGDI
tara:strand:- start:163 stop:336 length:174 start_codon:yes stop_codon:yes gene_type:complete